MKKVADIAMCTDKECPSAKMCRRFMDIPSTPYQCYEDHQRPDGDDKCDDFWGTADYYEGEGAS